MVESNHGSECRLLGLSSEDACNKDDGRLRTSRKDISSGCSVGRGFLRMADLVGEGGA